MQTNAELTQEYLDIIARSNGDIEGRRAAQDYMRNSTAIVHHQVVATSYVPRLFNTKTREAMKECAETAHRILVKVMMEYLDNPEYRKVFSFDPRLEELILIPRGYPAVLPFARVDTFMDEDNYTFKFCEFNGDGSSGMNENREISLMIARSPAFRAFVKDDNDGIKHRIEVCELFNSWIDEFLEIYSTFPKARKNPRFAIVDYLENGVVDEFKLFAGLFEAQGYPCVVADVRDLHFDGKQLTYKDGNRIDAIWRRCVTNDVITYWDESQDLIEAAKAQAVALIGSFAGHIVHDKQIFGALYDPRTKAILTDDENAFVEATVPYTNFLDSTKVDLARIKAEKDGWIIKPTDGYGAQDVYAGCAVSQDEWESLVDGFADSKAGFPFIVQAYITPFKTWTLEPDKGIEDLSDEEVACEPKLYNNLNGLYLYNGTFQGVFSRLGPLPTISKDKKGITQATIWVTD
ncbi:MAG: carboxylate--amine ligase [Coriobacteriia bacterium]|nr:carboxylate--amine ligase [Coriobacteriia bacterium]